jgi:hypothetical protein
MLRRSRVINPGCYTTEDVEPLIDLPHEKKACVGGDLCALKINADGVVKFRPYGPCLFVTNYTHADSPSSDTFVT